MLLLACNLSPQEVEARRSGFEPRLYYVGKISLVHEYTHKYPNKTLKIPVIVFYYFKKIN